MSNVLSTLMHGFFGKKQYAANAPSRLTKKLGKSDRGWIKQEQNQIERGKRSNRRNPKGKVLAHPRGKEAAKGYSYKESQLQLESNHKLKHKYNNNG